MTCVQVERSCKTSFIAAGYPRSRKSTGSGIVEEQGNQLPSSPVDVKVVFGDLHQS
jgi:hypothetical protein